MNVHFKFNFEALQRPFMAHEQTWEDYLKCLSQREPVTKDVTYQRVRSHFTPLELGQLPTPDKHYQERVQDDLVLTYELNPAKAWVLKVLLADKRHIHGIGCPSLSATTIISLLQSRNNQTGQELLECMESVSAT